MKNNFLQNMILSATNFQFYKDVLRYPISRSIRYLVVLVLVVTVLISIRYNITVRKEAGKLSLWILNNLPYIEIYDGRLRTGITSPLKIEEGSSVLIIDPSGTYGSLDLRYKNGLLLDNDNLYIRLDSMKDKSFKLSNVNIIILGAAFAASFVKPDVLEIGVLELSKVRNFVFDEDHIEKWKKNIINMSMYLFPLLYFIYFLIAKLIQAAFFAFIIVISNRTLKSASINYAMVLNICIYALTPAVLLMGIINLSGFSIPYIEFIYLFLYVAFLLGAMANCFPKRKKEVKKEDGDDWSDWV
ncbi:DUF1189 family protein [Candidatus Auribacterota bacterium]